MMIGARTLPARRSSSFAALLALAIVAAISLLLLRYQHGSGGADANQRSNRLEDFGSATSAAFNAVPDTYFESLQMGVTDRAIGVGIPNEPTESSSARWDLLDYEFSHLFAANPPCNLSAYILAGDPVSTGTPATIQISLNDRIAETLSLGSTKVAGAIPFDRAASTQPIFFSPLYQPSGFVVPIAWNGCAAKQWHIGIRLQHAEWKVARLGVIAEFTPLRPQFEANRGVVIVGLLLIFGAAAALFALFALVCRRYGLFALSVTLAVVLASMVTHEQWDFPVSVRFLDLLAHGHGNPVAMWGPFPMWPWLVSIIAPIVVALYSLFDYGSQEVNILFLKLFFSLACCYSAYIISRVADARVRKMVFFVSILSPIALYGVAAGYREVVAGLFAVAGLVLVLNRRYVVASIMFVIAGTVSEALLPLSFLPAASILLGWRNGPRAIVVSLVCASLVVGLVVAECLALPAGQFAAMLAFRTSSYRFGGSAWESIVEAYGFQLRLIRDYGFLENVAGFSLLCVPSVVKYVRLLRSRSQSELERQRSLLYVFLGFEFAFYISYTGIDPSTWYALVIVVLFVLTVTDAFNPFPLILSASIGLVLYSIVGLGDFVNWTYLWPMDVGLFGTLGHPLYVFVGLSNLLLLCGLIAAAAGDFRMLFGPRSLWFLLVFASAGVAATIFQYPEDVVVVGSFAGIIGFYIFRLMRIHATRAQHSGVPRLQYVAAAVAIGGSLELVSRTSLVYGLLGVGLALVALAGVVGLVDVVMIFGTLWLLWTEPGVGWLSEFGYCMLVVSLICALWAQRKTIPMPVQSAFSRVRSKTGLPPVTFHWEIRFTTEKQSTAPADLPLARPSETQVEPPRAVRFIGITEPIVVSGNDERNGGIAVEPRSPDGVAKIAVTDG